MTEQQHAHDFDKLVSSPFGRLRTLLSDVQPGASVTDLALGEPRHPMPGFVAEILRTHHAEFGRYPPIAGILPLKQEIANWLGRRYPVLDGKIDPEAHILPLNGSREGLFSIIFPLLDRISTKTRPVVLIPNPFYQVYAAAAYAAGAEPVFLSTSKDTGFLPDLRKLASDRSLLERTVAFYLCAPANPQGAIAGKSYWTSAIELARAFDFTLLADECYSEIYSDTPPPGALETAITGSGSMSNIVSFQSLSKRSNLPGLRSGFCAGDPEVMHAYRNFRNVAGPQMPLPIQHASAKVWADDNHVEENRALYRKKFDDAAHILADWPGYEAPEGGFFLWLDVSQFGGSEKAARKIYERSGVRVLPGRYLSHADENDVSPGDNFIRIALVDEIDKTRTALTRVAKTFN